MATSAKRVGGTAANDVLHGTTGDDQMFGYDGNDTLFGYGGRDSLYGGKGTDALLGGVGGDYLDGGAGSDFVQYYTAKSGVTVDLSNSANNRGDAAGDRFVSIENISGSNFGDILRGDAATNAIYAYGGDDRIFGYGGEDLLVGQAGRDQLFGGADDDRLVGGAGADLIDGGAGSDWARYETATSRVVASLGNAAINQGHAAGDRYVSIENLWGSKFGDLLRGDAGDNRLWGNAGNDEIHGQQGMDTLVGEAGNDSLFGEKGQDYLEGRMGNDQLFGGAGVDYLIGGGGGDLLNGGDGSDWAQYQTSGSRVVASLVNPAANRGDAAGDRYVSIENLYGTKFGDVLRGNAGDNDLWGNAGNDEIHGNAGRDILNGQAGADRVFGGVAADTFMFGRDSDRDTIVDFQDNVDSIFLSGLGVTSFAQARAHATQSGGNVTFDFGGGDVLVVQHTTIGALADDMVFG